MAKKPKYKVIPFAGKSGIAVPHSNAPVAIPYAGQGAGLVPPAAQAPQSRFFFTPHPQTGTAVPANVSGTGSVDPSVFASLPVSQQQQVLRHAGFNVTVDGQFGPQTQTARNAYMKGTPAATWNHAWQASHTAAPATHAAPVASPVATRTTSAAGTSGAAAAPTTAAVAQENPLSALLKSALGNASYQAPTTQQLLATARQIAQANLAPQLAANASSRQQALLDQRFAQQQALRDQQSAQGQALQDAQRNARFEQGVSAGLANVLKSQGPATEAAYHTATQDTQALGQGFSDQFRQAADASAGDTNAYLQSLGAPEGQMIAPTRANAAADVLYGVGGYLPGRTLAQQGAAFSAAANQLPATAVGRGQQLSADALQAGSDARQLLRTQGLSDRQQLQSQGLSALNQIRNQAAEIQAGRPAAVQSALSGLQTQQTQQAALGQNAALFPLLLADKFEDFPGINPVTGTPTKTATKNAVDVEKLNQARARIAQGDAHLTLEEQRNAISAARLQIDKAKAVKTKGLTAGQRQKYIATSNTIANTGRSGYTDKEGTQHPPLLYVDAIKAMQNAGVPWAIAQRSLNRAYGPGILGRPGMASKIAKGVTKRLNAAAATIANAK